ncbi:hypothetical protein [Aromatoleum bremense]|uniref:Uncharacterized protein n=1 Tax=Aromatoleum bremense TaxID=76115 RepID=A0ABX1NW46_9RHOO|nr:hypothetical protein [Aromatoleum bremense]NMG16245.1 hypothetical protein [Aromatoleum bremense]QTQ30111.1 Uncharacterized protein pbN1_01180 [Aromatoleum bremense]
MKQHFPASPGRRRVRARAAPPFRSGAYPDRTATAAPFVRIEDIAHALASTCCLAGQTRIFYSIAQHDYLASMIVPPQDALAALLLDVGEALRQLLPECFGSGTYVPTDIMARLGVTTPRSPTVAHADLVLRATERRDLGRPHDDPSPGTAQATPLALKIQPLPPFVAKHLFLDRYYELRPRDDPRQCPPAEGAS